MKIIKVNDKKYIHLTKEQYFKLHEILMDQPDSQKKGSFIFNLCLFLEEEEFV